MRKVDYTIEKRGHLHACIDREDGSKEELVPIINEVVITRAEPAKMARINLAVNNQHTQMYPSDGLIIHLLLVPQGIIYLLVVPL